MCCIGHPGAYRVEGPVLQLPQAVKAFGSREPCRSEAEIVQEEQERLARMEEEQDSLKRQQEEARWGSESFKVL